MTSHANHTTAPGLPDLISRYLVCPITHRPVSTADGTIAAQGSAFRGRVTDGVAVMMEDVPTSFFDDKFAVMQKGHEEQGGEWQFAYAQQIALLEENLKRGGVVLDIGCGPALPYTKPANAFTIGLDYSLPSIAANSQVDLKVCASAAALPIADGSIDTVVCFYSIHHIVGGNVSETEALVAQVLREFARVLKPGGECLIFEMSPVFPFGLIERLTWNLLKKILGKPLDMFFWPNSTLSRFALRNGWRNPPETKIFHSSPWITFPPIFSLPFIRIPRFLYPLQPILYRLQHPNR
jgi:SAM-dependent methyltransferase